MNGEKILSSLPPEIIRTGKREEPLTAVRSITESRYGIPGASQNTLTDPLDRNNIQFIKFFFYKVKRGKNA
jgi:hypothetical protein